MNNSIRPKNNKQQPHGYWKDYWNNGNLFYEGMYNNGKKIDIWKWHSTNTITNKIYYI